MKKSDKYAILFWSAFSLLILAVIYGQSTLDRQTSAGASGFAVSILKPILDPAGRWNPEDFHWFLRKAGHFAEYLLLGIGFGNLFPRFGKLLNRGMMAAQMLSVLSVAVSDEYLQMFTGRGSSVADVVLDYAGALTGIAMVCLTGYVSKKRRKKHEA